MEDAQSARLAEGYLNLDLNEKYIRNRAATYLFVAAESGVGCIHLGDTLVVDRSVQPAEGSVIVAECDGEYMVRRLQRIERKWALVTDEDGDTPHYISDFDCCAGVVTQIIHDRV